MIDNSYMYNESEAVGYSLKGNEGGDEKQMMKLLELIQH